jgi:hypothetical protein
MGESMCLEGTTDARAFEAYVEHFLAPTLSEGQVVVMDNLVHLQYRFRVVSYSSGHEISNLRTFTFGKGA